MTALLFRNDPYLRTATARVVALTEDGGVIPDASLFYPRGGGQPGDRGRLSWDGGSCEIATTVKAEERVALIPVEGSACPAIGARIEMALDWDQRYRFMRMHTALHLLSVVVPLPVTGGQIGAEKSRLDFDMPEATHEREAVQTALIALIDGDHAVTEDWIDEATLDANPSLVKTLSVKPPRGAGRIRLVRIGSRDAPVDLQPCGGTHVRSTAEIGPVRVGKMENKGRSNRRISITLES
ncbi:MAG: alanyl-tRNA editing protein [Pseudomonadota bacterium]